MFVNFNFVYAELLFALEFDQAHRHIQPNRNTPGCSTKYSVVMVK